MTMLDEKQLCKRCGSDQIATAVFTSYNDGSHEISHRCCDCGTLWQEKKTVIWDGIEPLVAGKGLS